MNADHFKAFCDDKVLNKMDAVNFQSKINSFIYQHYIYNTFVIISVYYLTKMP